MGIATVPKKLACKMSVYAVKIKCKWLMARFTSVLWNSHRRLTTTRGKISIFSSSSISKKINPRGLRYSLPLSVPKYSWIQEDQRETTNKKNSIRLSNLSVLTSWKNNSLKEKIKVGQIRKYKSEMIPRAFITIWRLLISGIKWSIRYSWPSGFQNVLQFIITSKNLRLSNHNKGICKNLLWKHYRKNFWNKVSLKTIGNKQHLIRLHFPRNCL